MPFISENYLLCACREFGENHQRILNLFKVEVWLNRVMDAMRSTVRHELSEAVVSYEEKPRDQWLFDYPAQVALCGTQIWWTTEVVLAFGRLEEGYENALKDYYKKQVQLSLNLINCCLFAKDSKLKKMPW